MRNLIVNADDLGWTEGVNRGIAEAHRKGLVTSTSLLANGQAFASAIEVARANPELGVGVHLNLSDGPPTASREQVAGLVSGSGNLEGGPESLLLRIAARTPRPWLHKDFNRPGAGDAHQPEPQQATQFSHPWIAHAALCRRAHGKPDFIAGCAAIDSLKDEFEIKA